MICPNCGDDIVFDYIMPIRSFQIIDEKISRDDLWEEPEYNNPTLVFHCSNDMKHNINTPEINKWTDKIEEQF